MTAALSWTDQVRASALELVRIAADSHRGTERALRHFVTAAVGHGVTVDELVVVTDMDRDTLLALTDPAVAC